MGHGGWHDCCLPFHAAVCMCKGGTACLRACLHYSSGSWPRQPLVPRTPTCRYVTDEVFWHIYFTLVRKHLPDKAYNWGPDDVLPRSAVGGEGDEEPFSLASLGKQLSKISSKLPPVTGPQGLELTSFVGGSSRREAAGSSSSGGAGATQASPVPAAPAVPRKPEGLLENDPDLEAYLEVWGMGSQGWAGSLLTAGCAACRAARVICGLLASYVLFTGGVLCWSHCMQVAITDAKESGEEESGGEELDLDSLMAQLEEEEEPAVGEGASAPAVKQ